MKTSTSLKTPILLLISFILFLNCSKDDDDVSSDLVGSWKVVYYIGAGDVTITKAQNPTWPDVNDGEITAEFGELDREGKGFVSGYMVSNLYSASYTAKRNGELSIGSVASTEANEPEWTSLYNISAAEEYEIRGDQLFIYSNNKINAIVLERD